MSRIEIEQSADEPVAVRLDMWKMAVNILRHDFGREFSPYDVHQLIRYLKAEETEDE